MDNKKTILLVENDRALTLALQDALTHAGFEVLVAFSGEEGLEIAREKQPDLIILDLMLGELTGVDLLRQLRQEKGWGEKVPVVILTGVPYLPNMDELKKLSDKIIHKNDFEVSSLIDTMKRMLA